MGGIAATAIFVILFSPFLAYVIVAGTYRNRRRRRQLARAGRLISWETAKQRVLAGDGMLFTKQLPNGGWGDVWWVDSTTVAEHPGCPLPSAREAFDRALIRKLEDPALNQWCAEHLPAITERASLVVGSAKHRKGWDEIAEDRVRTAWTFEFAPGPPMIDPLPPLDGIE
jgi:hypothetical protein